MVDDLDAARLRMINAAEGLPSIEQGASYGSPSLKVRGKFLSRVKDAGTLVVMCPLEEKEMLMAAAPDIYFETDHYKGWPAMLVRLSAIGDDELAHRLRRAFLMQAPKSLAKTLGTGA
jgi:hypothetical protein